MKSDLTIGFGGYLWRYVFYFAVVLAAIYGLLELLERFAPSVAGWLYNSGGATGLNVAVFMLPGIYVGQKWARTEHRTMPRGFGWGLAVVCSILAVMMCAGLAWYLMQSDPSLQDSWAELQNDREALAVVGGGIFVLLVLMTRLATWSAIRGELKRQART